MATKADTKEDASSSVVEGCRAPCRMVGSEDWPLAEIISIKKFPDERTKLEKTLYYIHYVDFNKRLDEWVAEGTD